MGKWILTGIIAGICSAVLDGFEHDYGLNHIASDVILTVIIIATGFILHKITKAPQH